MSVSYVNGMFHNHYRENTFIYYEDDKMKKQRIMLAILSILCITVWATFFLNVYNHKAEEVHQHHDKKIVSMNELTKETTESSKNEQLEREKPEIIDYTTRGIHPGDFDHLANNKIISVKTLLNHIQ